jgi:hypothetical protein
MDKRKLLIEVGGEKAIVELLWGEAPQICQALWDSLPLESTAHHAKLCNHEYMAQLRLEAPAENFQEVRIGDLGWWERLQTLNLWYDDPGPNGPLGPTCRFGVVESNLEGLAKVARQIWETSGQRIRLSKAKEV